MALSMKSYQVMKEHIDRIRKADEKYARHMWDEEKLDALNDFIDALADMAIEIEFNILDSEMPPEEINRFAMLEFE